MVVSGKGITNDVLRNFEILKFMSCFLLPIYLFNHWWKKMISYVRNQLKFKWCKKVFFETKKHVFFIYSKLGSIGVGEHSEI